MYLIIFLTLIVAFYGIFEKIQHQKKVDSIAIRINVNGIRGKSTVTRLMTGILREAGYHVVGKTTGTAARMLYWFTDEEKPIIRRREGPNIGEQRKVIAQAAKLHAEVIVSECMAVNPDYQIIFQEQLLQANIGVIVNVIEDHMEVMGPTLDNLAEAFTATIPYNGKLIIAPGPYVDYFKGIAAKRGTQVFVAELEKVGKEELEKFNYLVFPENVALALALATALEIPENKAWSGMLKSNPDPGVLRIDEVEIQGRKTQFVNGFAANDATSTLNIWQRVKEIGLQTEDAVIVINCRPDRFDRTVQFAEDVLPFLPAKALIVIGKNVSPVVNAYNAGKIPAAEMINLEGQSGEKIFNRVAGIISGRVVFGVGNIHGNAEEFIEILLQQGGRGHNYTSNDDGFSIPF